MNDYINKIEELSFNAWPSHKTELYDGWILRYSHNYTHRTNCVNIIGNSNLPLAEKVHFCENEYRLEQTPCIFKLSPLTDTIIDNYLENQGYKIEHVTENMTMPLQNFTPIDHHIPVCLNHSLTDEWIHSLLTLNGTTDSVLLDIVPMMYRAIPKPVISAYVSIDGKIMASGLGILDRDHIGIYAIYVNKNYRHFHFARSICNAILLEGKNCGAKHAYLQVVKGNTPARLLYESLGFKYLYSYWFRTKYVL